MRASATQAPLVLCQHPVAGKGNEGTAIATLPGMLALAGAVPGIDAIGCRKTIARKIVDKKAGCVLALKDNHRELFEDVKLWPGSERNARRLPVHGTVEKEHGRIETGRHAISARSDWLQHKPQWAGLKAAGMVGCVRA